jgi:hypothetical protein
MKKRNLLLVILAVLLVFGMVMSCGEDDGTTPGGTTGDKVSNLTLGQDGSATKTTTQITLSFSPNITGLVASDIELKGVTGVTKGTLSGTGPYTLAISGVTAGGTLRVEVDKAGFVVSPKTVTIYYVDPFAFYYQKFDCMYNKTKNITEFIDITKTEIKFTDNEKSKDTAGAKDDFLVFSVTKWEFVTTALPSFPGYTGNGQTGKTYTKGIKITGKITDAQPNNTTNGVYGPTTCPGITTSDITSGTEVYIFFYFTEEDDPKNDFTYLARSAFFANPAKNGVTPQNPLVGTASSPQIREYKNTASLD